MKRPRIVWTDAPPNEEETPTRPRRDIRPRVRLALAGTVLFAELGVIYFLLDSAGGDLLAVPALVAVEMVSPVRNRMIRTAERLARKVLPDHSPENDEGGELVITGIDEHKRLAVYELSPAPTYCPWCSTATKEIDLERDPGIHKRLCPKCGWASGLYSRRARP